MVIETHPQKCDSPTFANYDISTKIANRTSRGRSNRRVQAIGSNLLVGPSKCVRFSESPEVMEVDYSSVDTNDTWYTRAQLYLVQSETKAYLERLDQQHEMEDEFLGLERWVKRGALKFQQHQEAALQVVIGDSSSSSSSKSTQAIASAYSTVGVYTKMMANSRGMKLEREVRKYNNDLDNVLHDSITFHSSSSGLPNNHVSRQPCVAFDISMYRKRTSRCKVAVEEIHSALISVRKLGLHSMPAHCEH